MNAADWVQWLERYSVVILPALAVFEQVGLPLPAVPALLSNISLMVSVSGMACGDRPTTRMPWGASSFDRYRVSASLAACDGP